MEDENRKSRRVARREYLDNVRELVGFVKKRDKRVAKAQVSLKGLPASVVLYQVCMHGCLVYSLSS
jgi:hypothetical protein